MKKDFIRCNLCGEKFIDETGAGFDGGTAEELMFKHLFFYHPLEVLDHPKLQRAIAGFFENLGGRLADFLRGQK